jgi:RNA polymerase sigma-70 factor (ECF subfamily)
MCAAKLYRSAFALLRNREDAEDAVQDCWLRAYTNLKSFQGRSSFSTWLTRIVINSALMILRKKRNDREAAGHDLDDLEKDSLSFQLFNSSPNPEQICAEEERKTLLNAAVASLQPRLRAAVQMGQLRERSLKETAGALGISLSAVKSQLFHARIALRKSPELNAIVHKKNELAA